MSTPHRAEALKQPARSPRIRAVRVRPDETAGEAFRAIAAGCLERFHASADLLVCTGEPEALHQTRVALRQLRSAFSIFEPVVHDFQFEPLGEALGWLAASMNETRDLDTLIARYDFAPATLSHGRQRALAQAMKALGSARARHLWHDLPDWLDHGIWLEVRNPPDLTVSESASASLDRLRAKVKKKGRPLRCHDDKSIHKLRIAAKKLRYATEFFSGLFLSPREVRREQDFSKAMRKLQDRLGDLRDLAISAALLERFAVEQESRPALPDRALLLKRAQRKFEQLLDCEPYWN